MSLVRRQAPFVVALVLLALWSPAVLAQAPDSSTTAHRGSSPSQCLTYTLDFYAEKADFRVSVFGTVGFWVGAPAPGEGIAFGVFISPGSCGRDTVTREAPPLPPPLPQDPSFLGLP